MTTVAVETVPRIWVGCLHCYNSARLVGRWFDCTDPDDVAAIDLNAVHAGTRGPWVACEELWCLDIDFLPIDREIGLLEAAQWAHVYTEAGAECWPAVCAWVRSGSYIAEGSGDIPSLTDFRERYCGHWESFREYAEQLADDVGLMTDWPEDAQRYFNWSSWVDDQRHDYVVEDAGAPDYGVYVFRNL